MRLLGVFAHPDDESMGPGGTLAKYADAGHDVAVVTATEGGAGRLYKERPKDDAGREELKRVRREETAAACAVLGIRHLGFLGWEDGGLHQRDILQAEKVIAEIIRREKPDVVLTFHPSGISYHRDHRFMTHAAWGAVLGAAREGWYRDGAVNDHPPHAAARLYAWVPRRDAPYWADWPRDLYAATTDEITTFEDTSAYADRKWQAIEAHASQQDGPPFRDLYEAGAFVEECWVRLHPALPPGAPAEQGILDGLDGP